MENPKKIKRDILTSDYEKGGLKMIDINIFIIWQVMKYREICIKYNQYLKKLYFHM